MAVVLPQELFLSHSVADRDFVETLANALRRHGVPVWYSEKNLIGAQQWHDEIGAALRRCDWFAVVLSPSSVDSMWVKRELMKAFQPRRLENRIIPIVLQPADYERLSWVLDLSQMVNFTASFDDGMRDLLRIWGIGYRGANV
jgi:hypothetical protein